MKTHSLYLLAPLGLMVALLVIYLLPIWPATATESDLRMQTRTDAEIMAQIREIEAQVVKLQSLIDSANLSVDTENSTQIGLTITVNESIYKTSPGIESQSDAVAECHSVAYDPAYMWQLVTCDFNGERLYSDVFIAG